MFNKELQVRLSWIVALSCSEFSDLVFQCQYWVEIDLPVHSPFAKSRQGS